MKIGIQENQTIFSEQYSQISKYFVNICLFFLVMTMVRRNIVWNCGTEMETASDGMTLPAHLKHTLFVNFKLF